MLGAAIGSATAAGQALERARELGQRLGPQLHSMAEADAARVALAGLAQAELLGWCVPAQFGGAETGGLCEADTVSVRALAALRHELAYHSGMLDVCFVMQGLGSFALARGGSPALAGPILRDVVAGTRVAAFALTEPGAGSSVAEVTTEATPDGEGWRIAGHKTFISNAGIADFYTVLAKTPSPEGERSFAMFLVPAALAGVRAEPFDVIAPHPIGDVFFEGVVVPGENRLGADGAGMELALGNLARFRTTVAAAANGFARRALDESIERLSERHQFGKPLVANQALRFDLAEMETRLRAAELLVDEAAQAVDAEAPATLAVARAKLFATETAGYVCDRAVQHFGGLGVKRGTLVESLFREVRALRIYEGTSEIQKLIISKEILRPRR